MASTQFLYFCILGSIVSVQLFQLRLNSDELLLSKGSKYVGEGVSGKGMNILAQRIEVLENVVATINKDNQNILTEVNLFKERLERANQIIELLSWKILSTQNSRSTDSGMDTHYESPNGSTIFNSSLNSLRQSSGGINRDEVPKNLQKLDAVNRILKRNIAITRSEPCFIVRDNYRGTPVATEQRIAFHAHRLQDLHNPGNGQNLLLDSVLLNEGSAFSLHTGVFTCKVPGVYVFHHTLFVNAANWVHADIVKNGVSIGWAIALGSTNAQGTGSGMTVTSLNEGDEVWVRLYGPTQGVIILSTKTSFSGFMI